MLVAMEQAKQEQLMSSIYYVQPQSVLNIMNFF